MIGLAAALVLAAVALPALAQQVTTRAWEHSNFGRVVLDFDQEVGYSMSQDGREVTLGFEQEISGRLDPALQKLPNYVRNLRLSDDSNEVTFILNDGLVANDFTSGSAIVLDLVPRSSIADYEDQTGESIEDPESVAEADSTGDEEAQDSDGESETAADAATVTVRGGEHGNYSRLVFDWPESVGYALGREGGQVRVAFDRPGEVDASALNLADLENVGAIAYGSEDGGLVAGITVGPDATVRHFQLNDRVVVDALSGGGEPPAQADLGAGIEADRAAASAESPDTVAPDSDSDGDGGNQAGGDEALAQTAGEAPAGDAGGGSPGGDAGNGGPDPGEPVQLADFQGQPTRAPPGPVPTENPFLADGGVPEPGSIGPVPLRESREATADAAAATRGQGVAVPEEPEASGIRAQTPAETVPIAARIPLRADKPTAAASFRRAGYIWLVFDGDVSFDTQAMIAEGSDYLGRPEELEHDDATIMRMPLDADVYPRMDREGRTWTLELRQDWVPPRIDLQVAPQPDFALGPRLLVRANSVDTVVQVRDPAVGDRLAIAPLPAPGYGIAQERRYPEAAVLRSPQGIVVQAIADRVEVEGVSEGVSITAGEQGITMSSPDVVADLGSEEQNPLTGTKRLFAMKRWSRGGRDSYIESKRQLERQAALAPEEERNRDRLALAQYYTSIGLGAKALGVMNTMARADPGVVDPVEFRALEGAAHVLQNRPERALERLQVAQLDDEPEAQLWRAIARSQRGEWGEAKASLNEAEDVLETYPESLRAELAPQAIEIAWRAGDTEMAQTYLDMLPEQERVLLARGVDGEEYEFDAENPEFGDPVRSYWDGRLKADRGESQAAIDALVPATRSRDRLHRFMAGRLRTELRRDAGDISAEEAVNKLERLRFEWRGDWREFDLLRALGDSYWQAEDYRNSFDTLREAVSLYPDHPEAERVTASLTERFYRLFRDGAQELPTEAALNLFQDYRELQPPGERGDELVRAMADRLIDYGLLGRGGDMLEHQVENRLEGREVLEVGTRLAAVRLLDNEPQAALEALGKSQRLPIPEEIGRQRRILRARAQAAQGQVDQALGTLEGRSTQPERLLYTDIAWQNQRWEQAARGLNGLVEARRPLDGLDEETSQLILNLGIAYLLDDNADGVERVREQFGDVMAEGPDADAFRLVTRGEGVAETDLSTLNDQIAEVDDFRSFLTSYRQDRLERIAGRDDGNAEAGS